MIFEESQASLCMGGGGGDANDAGYRRGSIGVRPETIRVVILCELTFLCRLVRRCWPAGHHRGVVSNSILDIVHLPPKCKHRNPQQEPTVLMGLSIRSASIRPVQMLKRTRSLDTSSDLERM